MTLPNSARSRSTPVVVATGFTTAFLGDERTLREFIVGDDVVRSLISRGENAVLYLINDNYDPLNERQLRIGVNKDPRLMRQFEPLIGRPIAEIPDPWGCHAHYAEHFTRALLDRLHELDIHPVVLDTYHAYRQGHYEPYVSAILRDYHQLKGRLSETFPRLPIRNLFKVQCPTCSTLDTTDIRKVEAGRVYFRCERCGTEGDQSASEIKGKLGWKFDCAARWNLYRVDIEVFSKAHIAHLGTISISKFVSRSFFGGRLPEIVPYGHVRLDQELSGQLLRILPPPLLKSLFLAQSKRDLVINRDHVENFSQKIEVRAGTSYVDFVRKELPKRALQSQPSNGASRPGPLATVPEPVLVEYANCFSEFYYGRRYGLRLPDPRVLAEASPEVAVAARDVLTFALELRRTETSTDCVREKMRAYFFSRNVPAEMYHLLRRALGQSEGPNITTLLSILPEEYLRVVQMVLEWLPGSQTAISKAPEADTLPRAA